MDNIIANINTTKFLLDNNNLSAKRSLGQNFIIDANIIERLIYHANIDEKTAVIEIGPGLGALTQALLRNAEKVVSIEVDQNMVQILKDLFEDQKNFQLIHANILEVDLSALVLDLKKDYDKVMIIANLPYYITSDILYKFFSLNEVVDKIMIMVQREFAERLMANKSSKDYRPLTVLAQSFFEIKNVMKISKNVFYPRPNVDSSIISMQALSNDIVNLDAYVEFVEICFRQKRQTLYNNLRQHFGQDYAKELLFKSNLDLSVRAADLDINQFKSLFEVYYEV